jgi:hypothetical protein
LLNRSARQPVMNPGLSRARHAFRSAIRPVAERRRFLMESSFIVIAHRVRR